MRTPSRACLVLAALLSGACERTAATAPPPASPAPAAAPVGPALVYERTVGGNQDLYLAPAGGGPEKRLTDAPGTDMLPRFGRDGRTIYFASERTGNWQLYAMAPDGTNVRRLRTNAFREWQVEPSPDGKRIAFLSNQEGAEYLFVMELGTSAERVLVRHGRRSILGNPSWSPDGARIVFSSNWQIGHQIYLVNADGTGEARLTSFKRGGCEPRFSPDGRHVLHVSRGHLADKSRIVEEDLTTGAEKVLVDWPALNYTPTYSPDASEIAFTSNITGDWVVYRQRIADGKSWRVTFGPGPARSPEYQP